MRESVNLERRETSGMKQGENDVTMKKPKLELNNKLSPVAAGVGLVSLFVPFVKDYIFGGGGSLKHLCDDMKELGKAGNAINDNGGIFYTMCSILFLVVLVNILVHVIHTFKNISIIKNISSVATVLSLMFTCFGYFTITGTYGESPKFGIGFYMLVVALIISFVSNSVGNREEYSYSEAPVMKWECPQCGRKNKDVVCKVCGRPMDKRFIVK